MFTETDHMPGTDSALNPSRPLIISEETACDHEVGTLTRVACGRGVTEPAWPLAPGLLSQLLGYPVCGPWAGLGKTAVNKALSLPGGTSVLTGEASLDLHSCREGGVLCPGDLP